MSFLNKINSNPNYIYKSLFFIGICYFMLDIVVGFTTFGMWYDELFSVFMVSLPLNDMINLGIQDVHPLLYYFIYKFFVMVCNLFNYHDLVIIGRVVSLLPFGLLAIFNYTKVSKVFGWKVTGLFNLLVFSTPALMKYALELRMYGWALLFITIGFVYIKEILNESNFKNWTILTICTILAAYTHYFAALEMFALYLTFLIYIIFKNRSLLKNFIISTIISVLAYAPWVPIIFKQGGFIQGNFWVPDMSLVTLAYDVFYIFGDYCENPDINIVIAYVIPALVAFLLICLFATILVKNYKKGEIDSYVKIGLITFLLVPIIGIIISLIDTPIFFMRYGIPMFGMFWLSLSILFSKIESKKFIQIALSIILISGVFWAFVFVSNQQFDYQETIDKYDGFHNSVINEGDIIISDGVITFIESDSYYRSDCDNYQLYNLNSDTQIRDISNQMDNLNKLMTSKTIQDKINNGSNVYFIDESNDNYNNLIKSGYNITKTNITQFDTDIGNYTVYAIHK